MNIHTPQGLRIRLDVPTSFGLMARLYPDIRPKQILKTTEDISLISSALGFVTGMFCFVLQLSPQSISVYTLIAMVAGIIFNASGIILSPFVQLGSAFNRIYVFFLPTIIAILVGYMLTGWQGVIAYLFTRVMASFVSMLVGRGLAKQSLEKLGTAYTTVERNFFNAYRYHAIQVGKSMSLELSFEELDEAFWRGTYNDYVQNNPKLIQQ
jgi:hypothetical protein